MNVWNKERKIEEASAGEKQRFSDSFMSVIRKKLNYKKKSTRQIRRAFKQKDMK